MVLHDWQAGKIPYFCPPPEFDADVEGKESKAVEGDTLPKPDQDLSKLPQSEILASDTDNKADVKEPLDNESDPVDSEKTQKLKPAKRKVESSKQSKKKKRKTQDA